jgi:GT2 family glycosyltransferase/glycosyltransferase involved in cell wall biosynthesis
VAAALPPALFDVAVCSVEALDRAAPPSADLIWIWRASGTPALRALVDSQRQLGRPIVFDIDDLMFRPDLAVTKVIDGIRSQKLGETDVKQHFAATLEVLQAADHATAPTVPLIRQIRQQGRPATMIPNGFDRQLLEAAQQARAWRSNQPADGLLRIGYASGSFTHQRDFAEAAPALAALLAERPEARLVLFRRVLDIAEFPLLAPFADRIEWRDLVPVAALPMEYARFDINLAPLEVGNPFCEGKSELKFFEAALVAVPTIASPTEPFETAIRPGVTGLLAADTTAWLEALRRLATDPPFRQALGRRALQEVLWRYGPERRSHLATRLVRRLLSPPELAATIAAAEMAEIAAPPAEAPPTAPFDILLETQRRAVSRVSVVMPLYNYRGFVTEALDSVRAQNEPDLDLIVVDDCSTDDSAAVARAWLERHGASFARATLLRHTANAGLGPTRNTAIAFAETELYLPLDADNLLLPGCVESCVAALDYSGAAFAYPRIEIFGDRTGTHHQGAWDPTLLRGGNVVDAMALVRKASWAAVGGYAPLRLGWEDFDFWCKFIEAGFFGVHVPEAGARYRSHGASMLRTLTDASENKRAVIDAISARHRWLLLEPPAGPS